MKILAVSQDTPDTDWTDCAGLLRDEAQEIWRLQQSGVLREIWFTVPDRNAVVMLECNSIEEASEILRGLPLVRTRRIEFSLMQLGPYDGYARLFGNGDRRID